MTFKWYKCLAISCQTQAVFFCEKSPSNPKIGIFGFWIYNVNTAKKRRPFWWRPIGAPWEKCLEPFSFFLASFSSPFFRNVRKETSKTRASPSHFDALFMDFSGSWNPGFLVFQGLPRHMTKVPAWGLPEIPIQDSPINSYVNFSKPSFNLIGDTVKAQVCFAQLVLWCNFGLLLLLPHQKSLWDFLEGRWWRSPKREAKTWAKFPNFPNFSWPQPLYTTTDCHCNERNGQGIVLKLFSLERGWGN